MRSLFVTSLRGTLRALAQATIWRFRPAIIGVTGNAGKTSTKLAIASVLGVERHVRISRGNFNNELGLPIAILGDWTDEELAIVSLDAPAGENTAKKLFFWIKVVFRGIAQLLFGSRSKYPEILVLEYGIDHPGDMRALLDIARPNIGVITAIGDIPVHVEFFESAGELAREKARLIECLPSSTYAVMNFDDPTVMNLKDRTRANLTTFGFNRGAQVRISGFEYRMQNDVPAGISFKLEYGGAMMPVRLNDAFGKSQAYCTAAAAAIGLIFGMNLVKISEALQYYKPAPHRTRFLPGANGSALIDDTYNANVLSTSSALEMLAAIPAKRKVAVLGDMTELGEYTLEAHERIGRLAAESADVLVAVGENSKLTAEAARKAGLRRTNIVWYEDAEQARAGLQNMIKKGDLVLVKASHSIGLEVVVEGLKV